MKKLSKGEAEITIESFDQLKEMLSLEEIRLLKQGQINTNILDAIAISLIDVCEKHNRELESCQASTALQMIIKMLKGEEHDFRNSIIDNKNSLGASQRKEERMDIEKIVKEALEDTNLKALKPCICPNCGGEFRATRGYTCEESVCPDCGVRLKKKIKKSFISKGTLDNLWLVNMGEGQEAIFCSKCKGNHEGKKLSPKETRHEYCYVCGKEGYEILRERTPDEEEWRKLPYAKGAFDKVIKEALEEKHSLWDYDDVEAHDILFAAEDIKWRAENLLNVKGHDFDYDYLNENALEIKKLITKMLEVIRGE